VTEEKIRENRLRRAARRQGLKLTKSRRRDPRALDYGRYWLTDTYTNRDLVDINGYTLDEVEEVLHTREVTR
jgi:hypothetical protein